jgi:hypothetical protein
MALLLELKTFLHFLNKSTFCVELQHGIHSGGGIQLFIKIQLNTLTGYLPLIISHLSYFRHCSTSRKVAVSIPDGVTGVFIDISIPVALFPWDRINLK